MPVSPLPCWKESPFLRLLPPFIIGLLWQHYFPCNLSLPAILLCLILAFLLLLPLCRLKWQYRFRKYQGLLINLLMAGLGLLTIPLQQARELNPTRIPASAGKLIQLTDSPVLKQQTFRAPGKLLAYGNRKLLIPGQGNLLLYFARPGAVPDLATGSLIWTKKLPEPILFNGNPGEFNYADYCQTRHITGRLWLRPGDFVILAPSPSLPVHLWPVMARQYLQRLLRLHIPSARECGLAEALLTGYRKNLESDLLQQYAQSGVIHLIAISGLHVGLIYSLLLFLLKPLRRISAMAPMATLLPLAGTWFFALITGASPSVLRASLMFTCMALAPLFGRQSPSFNGLAASAFLLLCGNGRWLWDAGFQLSYAAVCGILLFSRPIGALFHFRYKLANAAWQLTAVTLAAQSVSFPLVLYHFHQFPNYFLLSNLLALPLASLILPAEMLLCALHPATALADRLGWLITQLLRLLNGITGITAHLPGSTSSNLYLSLPQVLILYALVASAGLLWLHKRKWGLHSALLCLWLLAAWQPLARQLWPPKTRLIVYNIPGQSLADFQKGSLAWTSSFPVQLPPKDSARLLAARSALGISGMINLPGPVAGFAIDSCLVWQLSRQSAPGKQLPNTARTIIIVTADAPRRWMEWINQPQSCQVVIDSSVPARLARQWAKACYRRGIACFAVVDKGAFVMSLP